MRRAINSTYITLDGVTELLEQWHFEFMDDEANEVAFEHLQTCDAALMGRVTYDGFAPYGPPCLAPWPIGSTP